jgi:hypothetical protein
MLPSTLVTHGGGTGSRTRRRALIRRGLHTDSSYTSKLGGCGQIRTDYLALMRRLLIRMSFAADGEGDGHRTRIIRLWRPTFSRSELHPHFQRAIKNPDVSRGLVLVARMHSDPQDTTPQMTRLPVILTMSRLKVLSIASIHS